MLIASLAVAAFVAWLLREGTGTTREAAWMGGIFVLAALLWVTEALPLFATSCVCGAFWIEARFDGGEAANANVSGDVMPSPRLDCSTAKNPRPPDSRGFPRQLRSFMLPNSGSNSRR